MRVARGLSAILASLLAGLLAASGCSNDESTGATGGAGATSSSGGGGTGGHNTGLAGNGGGGAGGASGIIPADRQMDWHVAGVPGGIPTVSNICATVTDAAQLQAAIDGCSGGGVVYVPAGTYALGTGITNGAHNDVVVRGDGPGQTIFTFAVADGTAFNLGNADWPPPAATIPVVAGATRGSSTITVDSTSATGDHGAFHVGGLIRIEAAELPPFAHNLGVSAPDMGFSFTFRVTALTDTAVTFEPALPFDFTPYGANVALFAIAPLTGVGLEDFTIDLQGTGAYGIALQQLWGCWVKNVEIANSANHLVSYYTALHTELRHCYFHDTVNAGPNTEGVDFYRYSDWNLIEDNIVYAAGGIDIGDWQSGDAGNVIAYNFAYATSSGDASVAGYDIDVNHGSNNSFNLLEGNIAGGVIADGYFGSTSHDTLFRNWLTATHPTAANNLCTVKLKHFGDYFNVVGNVLGTSAFPTSGNVDGNGFAWGGFYDAPQSPSYDDGWSTGVQVIYELGYPNMGNTGYSGTLPVATPIDYGSQGATLADAQALDLNVAATLLRHGNYDYFDQAIVWDPAISEHTLPDSLFRSGKPSFFGSLAWPPFDPAAPPGAFDDTNLARIPAGYRYLNGTDP